MQCLELPEEARDVAGVLRSYLDRHAGDRAAMALLDDTGSDPAIWRGITEELELLGLMVPARLGGAGLDDLAQAAVFEELGRALAVAPCLSTMGWAIPLLLEHLDDPHACALLERIVAERLKVAVAVTEPMGTWVLEALGDTSAHLQEAGWTLSGTKDAVVDGLGADLLLVVAHDGDGPATYVVKASADGVDRFALSALDVTRPLARVVMDAAPAARLVGDPAATRRGMARASVAHAAEQVGGAQHALDLATAHARERHQFGRPIGSFQAIKHACADVHVQIESARSLVYAAAEAFGSGDDDAEVSAAMAQATASEAFLTATETAVQVLGGIGFTWEHPAHLHLKRALGSVQLHGDPRHHRAHVAAAMLGQAA